MPAYASLAGVLAAAVLLAAGCGGDDSAPPEPVPGAGDNQGPAPLDKAAFIEQADAICGEANAALAALDAGDPQFQAAQEQQITQSELDSLQSLSPPDQERSVLESFLSALQDQVDALSLKQTALEQGDDPATADAEASTAAASAQAAAADYGFTDCANASEVPPTSATTTVPTVTTPTTPTTVAPTTPSSPPTGGTGGADGGIGGGTGGGGTGGGGTGSGTGGTGGGVSP
ncbi:MAG: hypothetical protein AABM66_08355 [Actinomycetota bacterium]